MLYSLFVSAPHGQHLKDVGYWSLNQRPCHAGSDLTQPVAGATPTLLYF